MQQRFCSCGCGVWVQYLFPNMDCQIIFRSRREDPSDRLSRCPRCGRALNIDDLS
jgi:hypothetical protein